MGGDGSKNDAGFLGLFGNAAVAPVDAMKPAASAKTKALPSGSRQSALCRKAK
jgi:hypothetical protein